MNSLFIFFDDNLKNNPFILKSIIEIQQSPIISINLLYEKYGKNIQNINRTEEQNLFIIYPQIYLFIPIKNQQLTPIFYEWINALLTHNLSIKKELLPKKINLFLYNNETNQLTINDKNLIMQLMIPYKVYSIATLWINSLLLLQKSSIKEFFLLLYQSIKHEDPYFLFNQGQLYENAPYFSSSSF